MSCEMLSNLLKATQWSGGAGTGMPAPSCISEPWVGTHSHMQDTERRVRIKKMKNCYKKWECLEKWQVRNSMVLWKWVLCRRSDGILLWGGFHNFTGLLPPLVHFSPFPNFQKNDSVHEMRIYGWLALSLLWLHFPFDPSPATAKLEGGLPCPIVSIPPHHHNLKLYYSKVLRSNHFEMYV